MKYIIDRFEEGFAVLIECGGASGASGNHTAGRNKSAGASDAACVPSVRENDSQARACKAPPACKNIPRGELPENVSEGDTVIFENGVYLLDREDSNARKARIDAKMRALFPDK